MSLPATELVYLRYQHDDSEKLRIRIETHERFTVGDADFNAVLIEQRIVAVHRDAALKLGYTPLENRGATFHTDHLEEVRPAST